MDTTASSLLQNTFNYMMKVWLLTFGIGTAGYMFAMGFELFAANLWAFCASIPVLIPVYYILYFGNSKDVSASYKKAYVCIALLVAYFLTCVVLGLFFQAVEMIGLALMFGVPHFIIGLLAIWLVPLPIKSSIES